MSQTAMGEADSQILEFLEEGLFLYGVGRTQEAVSRWRKVLELDPGNERAMDYIRTAGIDPSAPAEDNGAGTPVPSPPGPPAPVQSAPVAAPQAAPPAAPQRPPGAFQPPAPSQTAPSVQQPQAVPPPPPPPAAPTNFDRTRDSMPASPPPIPPAGPPPSMGAPPPPVQPPAGAGMTPTAAPNVDADARKRSVLGVVAQHYKTQNLDAAYQVLDDLCKEFPGDPALQGYVERLRGEMMQKFGQEFGSLERIPQLAVSNQDLMNRQLSPEEGFILSRIDGSGTIEDLLTALGLDRFTALRMLSRLQKNGLIIFV